MTATEFAPGSLVHARGREWVVLPDSEDDLLVVRPLGGADDEIAGLYLPVEKVTPASFDPPTLDDLGDHRSARLLHDALRLGFRIGTGPFRSFGHLGCEPRPYQIVPLMMALRLDPVRLLIADDVGIGKTIEAALVARELLDQGEASGLAVLCPPHLADQWQRELAEKFNLEAETLLAGTAARLERGLGATESLFERYPYLVISLDFIKSERRRHEFLTHCPDLVIVDEAHTCADQSGGRSSHLRYELLRKVAEKQDRHLILITATPHQGKEESYADLLGFIGPEFADPDARAGKARERLARHFVQRRRGDIKRYMDEDTQFPDRDPSDLAYAMTKEYRAFFEKVLAFCQEIVRDPEGGERRRHVRWWAALGLLRAVGSSPQAAAASLRNRAKTGDTVEETDELGRRAVFDEAGDDEADAPDLTPGAEDTVEDGLETDERRRRRLNALAKEADALVGAADAKVAAATKRIKKLLADGSNPIVFCRFIDTAEAVAEALRKALAKGVTVEAVTGRLPAAERELRVAALGEQPKRVLVATDCLSEGINLQDHFDAVLHYDLSWNPTRHEQREGRADRFGQPSSTVTVTTLYGSNNPIDGYVLNVILRKHRAIREETGVIVPVPTDVDRMSEAVLEGLLMAGGDGREIEGQLALFEKDVVAPKQRELHAEWDAAKEREKVSRSRFAQATLDPSEVAKALQSARWALGASPDVLRFATTALLAYGAPVSVKKDSRFSAELTGNLPGALRDQLGAAAPSAKAETISARTLMPIVDGEVYLTRTHPITEALATYTLDTALDPLTPSVARRASVVTTDAVSKRTTLLVLRLRFRLNTDRRTQVAEESIVLAYRGGSDSAEWLDETDVAELLDAQPSANTDAGRARQFLTAAIDALPSITGHLDAVHRRRAEDLLGDHRRVREAAKARIQGLKVEPIPPADVLGVYVYLPA